MLKFDQAKEFPHEIMLEDSRICVSIYMPTNRESDKWRQDRIRFKNIVGRIEKFLIEGDFYKDYKESILDPLNEILENPYVWNGLSDGLAILLNEDYGVYYILNRSLEEYVSVDREFYLKPLIRNFQSYDKYQILALSKSNFKLYEGTRYSFQEIEIPEDIITDIEDLLDEDRKGRVLSFGTYRGEGTSYHGHNTKDEGLQNDMDRFFRYVDDFVYNEISKPSQAPLILIALEETQGHFRSLSKNNYLLDQGVSKSVKTLSPAQLREDAWQVIEPIYRKKTEDILDRYEEAKSKLMASSDPLQIAHACDEGRVESLLIQANKRVERVYDKETGKYMDNPPSYSIADMTNQLAIMTLQQKGQVVVLPEENFPTDTGCACIYRF